MGTTVNSGIKPFRFYNLWTDHMSFKDTILQSWNKPIKSAGLVRIVRKLSRLKVVLRNFNKHIVGDVAQNYSLAKDMYQTAQASLQANPHSTELQREESLAGACFVYHSKAYDSFLRQKSKLIEKFDDVVAHFVTHFQKIMGSNINASVPIQSSCFRLGHRLEAEISEAIFDFFESGVLPEEVNMATICLVPKIETPTKAGDYRPIASCNAIYKCISKMLCGRLATVLPSLVHQNQGAFAKNRLLAHNILILQDIIKGYKRKNASPRCVMKIDLSKAYDMLGWNFMEAILTEFCFPIKFIKWIMACLKDPSYLILMNGRIHGEFRGKKGLRQGDPISPLLFVLAMEYCTRLLCQASLDKRFRFHLKCKPLKLVNLCFADDLVIFCKGVSNSVQIMRDIFTEFRMASGFSANLQKSQVYFGGLDDRETHQLLESLQFTEGNFPLKYLGVPLRTTKWKAGDCAIIITKIQQKLHIWASRHLLFARRAQLVNTMLLSLRLLNRERVAFANVVWCSLVVPKHRFILWKASLGHLLTRDKLHYCNLELPSLLCPVCEMEQESHAHLFFVCPFSQQLMAQMVDWLGRDLWPNTYEQWCT
ncbi:uncharacterized protein LOC133800289 [Humulus lupulus]|uniref:uncharacterized protein LOC133800289 n=1 Tax=Humulus lupulus TaxID=3486 RepID=UPI002B40D714|nr:uncharacterized protein LOC133800289 [Humulus lupulus]